MIAGFFFFIQLGADHLRREFVILGLFDEAGGQGSQGFIPAFAQAFGVLVLGSVSLNEIGVRAFPVVHHDVEDIRGGAFVNDSEAVIQAGHGRFFADDIVGQSVQGAHAVTDAGQQVEFAQEAGYTAGEVVHG